MKKIIISLLLLLFLTSCVQQKWIVFHVNKRFDGTVEYTFLKGNKAHTIKTDSVYFKNREKVTMRQIKSVP
jgi:hypothetical protein